MYICYQDGKIYINKNNFVRKYNYWLVIQATTCRVQSQNRNLKVAIMMCTKQNHQNVYFFYKFV